MMQYIDWSTPILAENSPTNQLAASYLADWPTCRLFDIKFRIDDNCKMWILKLCQQADYSVNPQVYQSATSPTASL